MTNTRPCRLTSLQFSQIRLTLERTFMTDLIGRRRPKSRVYYFNSGSQCDKGNSRDLKDKCASVQKGSRGDCSPTGRGVGGEGGCWGNTERKVRRAKSKKYPGHQEPKVQSESSPDSSVARLTWHFFAPSLFALRTCVLVWDHDAGIFALTPFPQEERGAERSNSLNQDGGPALDRLFHFPASARRRTRPQELLLLLVRRMGTAAADSRP